jgi:hypothetical protein
MSFSESIIAVPTEMLSSLPTARELYGEWLPLRTSDPFSDRILTLMGEPDVGGSDALRAVQLGVSRDPIFLSDGRAAFAGWFTDEFLAAIGNAPELSGVEILTEAQYATLTAPPEEEE